MSGKVDKPSTAELIEALDTWLASGAESEPEPSEDDYFGLCPICHQKPIWYHVGRMQYAVCEAHRVYWYLGENIISCWQWLSEDDYRAAAKEIATMHEAKPYYHPELSGRSRQEPAEHAWLDDGEIPF